MGTDKKDHDRTNDQQTCARCGGLLISDLSMEMLGSLDVPLPAQRCVQCGDVLDPVIVSNRQPQHPSRDLSAMNLRRILQPGIFAAVLVLTGCATDLSHSVNEQAALTPVNVVSHEQARQLAFTYRRQATELHELAQRMGYEAQWYSGQSGASQEESTRRQLQAKDISSAATEADELARAYQWQVPHGQMQ